MVLPSRRRPATSRPMPMIVARPRRQIAPQILVVSLVMRRGHQHADVPSDDLRLAVPEQRFGPAVDGRGREVMRMPERTAAGARVLVVDNEALIRWSLGEYLSLAGYEVAEAADGGAALEALSAEPAIDLAILDLPRRGRVRRPARGREHRRAWR
jgi:CheY-like chemotaxis protein